MSPFGYGILKNTSKKILERMDIAASIISLVYQVTIDKPLYDYD
jgi:hypothetical protein